MASKECILGGGVTYCSREPAGEAAEGKVSGGGFSAIKKLEIQLCFYRDKLSFKNRFIFLS